VSASSRPSRIAAIARAAATIAHVPEPAVEPADVERARPEQRDLLAHREQQLEPDLGGLPRAGDPPRQLEDDRHSGFVVGAENPVVRVLPTPVDAHGLDRRGQRHRIQVRAQQNAVGPDAGDPREQVAGVRADAGTDVILVDL
jgi:hypothetical protein